MQTWYYFDSGPGEPAFNMALDHALLEAMPRLGTPVLRSYSWTVPAATFGYFQRIADVESLTPLRSLVRRPTGGGIVPHDADWTYSMVFPAGHGWYQLKALESYRRVHSWLMAAFALLDLPMELAPAPLKRGPGQCFVGYERYDLLWRGQKLAGAAQRRTRDGLLVQGSVQPRPAGIARGDWERAMHEAQVRSLHVKWLEFQADAALENRAGDLARNRYSQPAYNHKR